MPAVTAGRAARPGSVGGITPAAVLSLQRLAGNAATSRWLASQRQASTGQATSPTSQPRTIRRRLDWTADRLKTEGQFGTADEGDKRLALVIETLNDYVRLLGGKAGDGPHLATSLGRIVTAAEAFLGRVNDDGSPVRVAVRKLLRDAADEQDYLVGQRDINAQSAAFTRFDSKAEPPVTRYALIPANAGYFKGAFDNDQFKPTHQGTFGEQLMLRVLLDNGHYLGFQPTGTPKAVFYMVRRADCTESAVVEIETDLFPRDPRPEDVRQGRVGDCFLLAPAASIAAQDPRFIRRMMRQNGDGSVTVRFFDPQGQPGSRTFAVKYVNVKKSEVRAGAEEAHAKGAVWVKMLEKAFACSKLGTQMGAAKQSVTYGNLEGGQSAEALMILLGREVTSTRLEGNDGDLSSGETSGEFRRLQDKRMPWGEVEKEKLRRAQAGEGGWHESVVYTLVRDEGLARAWLKFIEGDFLLDLGLTTMTPLKYGQGSYDEALTFEDVERFLTGQYLPGKLVEAVVGYLKEQRLLPGARGTGRYTTEQLDLYDELARALRQKKPVTADTPSVVAVDQTNTGMSAGEPKGGGLVGKHSYSVLAVSNRGGVRYVHVRNPWGYYSRTYGPDMQPQAVNQGDGVSVIELGDFVKRFTRFHY